MSRLIKKLIILSLTLVIVTAGGWYWYSSAEEAQAKVPWNASRISDIVSGMGSIANLDLASFNSLSEVSSIFRTVGGENATMEGMATWLDAFGQMGGGVEGLLDGNYRSIGDVVTGLGQITDLGGATDMLNSLGGLGANIDDILSDGIGFQNGADLIANLGEMTNLTGSADIIRSFGDLGANVETLFNGGVSFDSIGDLFGSLDEISDYESVQNLFDRFKDDGGSWDDFVTNVANDDTDVGTVINDPEVTMEELGPPGTGDGSQTQPRPSETRSGVGTEVGQTSQEAKQKLAKERKQDEQKCKAQSGSGKASFLGDASKIFNAVNGFSQSQLIDIGFDSASNMLLKGGSWSGTAINAVSSATGLDVGRVTELAGKIPGFSKVLEKVPGAGIVTGALGTGASYVPVVEQDGDLIDLTEDTNELTSEIKDLQVQICTHLKTIKRVQLNLEDKEFIGDTRASEERTKRLNDWQKENLNYLTSDRTKADGSKGSYTPTVEEYTKEKADNASKVTVTQAKNSGSAFANSLASLLKKEESRSSFNQKITSDIAENQFKEFADPVKSRELNYQSWMTMFLYVSQPK